MSWYNVTRGHGCRAAAVLFVSFTIACRGGLSAPADELLIVGTEYTFEAPAEIASGPVVVRLRNDGITELHNVAVVRLVDDHTPADFVEFKATDPTSPPWAIHVGGVESLPPGAEGEVVLNLQPGPHLLVCYHQLREPGQLQGRPHFELGMIASLSVTEDQADAPLPNADGTLAMFDYGFTLSGSIRPGRQLLRVIGAGPQDHNALIWRLAEGRTAADLITWLESDRTSRPPGHPLGGMSALSAGQQAFLPLDLQPGRYAFVCLVADEADLRFHASHGMTLEFSVS